MIAQADHILKLAQKLHLDTFGVNAAEPSFRQFHNRGVTFELPDNTDDVPASHEDFRRVGVVQRAHVDAERVLREALAPLGYAIAETRDEFYRLRAQRVPENVSVFFLRSKDIKPEAILRFSDAANQIEIESSLSVSSFPLLVHPMGANPRRTAQLMQPP